MMEFHEKLQQLRKERGLTQEQLAERLFVSRAAVSKWESGRGYPNLESLKDLSRLYSVSIDELLSNDELIRLAETENRDNLHRVSLLVFGALDMMAAALLFLPLFGRQEGGRPVSVALVSCVGEGGVLLWLCVAALVLISAFGLLETAAVLTGRTVGTRLYRPISMGLCAAAILWFALFRQPYVTALLFLLFLVKGLLLLRER